MASVLTLVQPASGLPPGLADRQGAVCEEGAVDGILSFHREYSKSTENASSGNVSTGEDGSSRDRVSGSSPTGAGVNGMNGMNSMNGMNGANGVNGLNAKEANASSNRWAYPESRLPTRDRSNGQSPMYNMQTGGFSDPTVANILSGGSRPVGFVDEIQDMSTSPGDGMSNRPTPNSSTASEGRQNLAPPLQPNSMHSAGSSFDASPVSPPRVLVGGQQGSRVDRNSSGGYFATANGGSADYGTAQSGAAAAAAVAMSDTNGLGGIMTGDPSSNEYMIPDGWNLNGQSAMTPVSEGVLRTIINMGPMETMDLGWGSNP